jgi:hypothetical protein
LRIAALGLTVGALVYLLWSIDARDRRSGRVAAVSADRSPSPL